MKNIHSSWIFINWLIQNNYSGKIDLEFLLEFISYNPECISLSNRYEKLICQGLTSNLAPSVRKRSLYLLSKIISSSHHRQQQQQAWTKFFTFYDSAYQTNKSILEPVLVNISNLESLLCEGLEIKWILVIWQRAIANEFASMKKMALEYFLKIPFSQSFCLHDSQKEDWIIFFHQVLFPELDTFFLYTEFDLVTLNCEFGNLLSKFIAKLKNFFPTFDLLGLLSKIKTPSCIVYCLYGINECQFYADFSSQIIDTSSILAIASHREFYSTKLKTLLYSELLRIIFSHKPPSSLNSITRKLIYCICNLNVPCMQQLSREYLQKNFQLKSEDFISEYLCGNVKIETLKVLFQLCPPFGKLQLPINHHTISDIKECILLEALKEYFIQPMEMQFFISNYFLTCAFDDFIVENLTFSSSEIIHHLTTEDLELRKKAFKAANTFESLSLTSNQISQIKTFSMKQTANLKYAVLAKSKAEFSFDELIECLENSHSYDAIHVLKCFGTHEFSTASSLKLLFRCICQLLVECDTQLRIYFAILEEYLSIVLKPELLASFNSHFQEVFYFFLSHKKKGVTFVLSQKLVPLFRMHSDIVPLYANEFVSFLTSGPFQESLEDKVTTSLCSNLTLPFDFYGDSSMVNSIRIRASFNSLLASLTNCDEIFQICIERLHSPEYDCTLNVSDAYPNTPKQILKLRLLMSVCLAGKNVRNLSKKWILKKLFGLLQKEPLQSARYFIEFAMIGTCYFSSHLNDECFQLLYEIFLESLNEKPSTIISLLTTFLHLFPKLEAQNQKSLLSQIVCLFLNGNFMVRIYACFFFHRIVAIFPKLMEEQATLKALSLFIERNEYAQKTIAKFNSIYMFNGFNVEKDYNCQFIFHSLVALGDCRCMTEVIPVALFEEAGIPSSLLPPSDSVKIVNGWNEVNFANEEPSKICLKNEFQDLEEEENKENSTSMTIQRKIIPWELSNEQPSMEKDKIIRKKPQGTIFVVASLLEKIPNVAGLCRTCEIFGATSLIVDSLAILESPTFKSISVTSDLWLSVEECPKEQLGQFLVGKKSQNFQLVGLEQTSNSVSLEHFKPTSKTVLVLGNEKHGMPVEIINLMDKCVEIPQFGIIRSLNVHVSGSITLWEMRKHLSLSESLPTEQ